MTTFDLTVKVPVDVHTCTNPDCETEFSILLILRPSESYLGEYPEATGSYSSWATDSIHRPFCPSCGKQLEMIAPGKTPG